MISVCGSLARAASVSDHAPDRIGFAATGAAQRRFDFAQRRHERFAAKPGCFVARGHRTFAARIGRFAQGVEFVGQVQVHSKDSSQTCREAITPSSSAASAKTMRKGSLVLSSAFGSGRSVFISFSPVAGLDRIALPLGVRTQRPRGPSADEFWQFAGLLSPGIACERRSRKLE